MLLNMDGFTGEAEVLGTVCRVEYNGQGKSGSLTIDGLDLQGAQSVLMALHTGKLTAVEPVRSLETRSDEPAAAPGNGHVEAEKAREADEKAAALKEEAAKEAKRAAKKAKKEAEEKAAKEAEEKAAKEAEEKAAKEAEEKAAKTKPKDDDDDDEKPSPRRGRGRARPADDDDEDDDEDDEKPAAKSSGGGGKIEVDAKTMKKMKAERKLRPFVGYIIDYCESNDIEIEVDDVVKYVRELKEAGGIDVLERVLDEKLNDRVSRVALACGLEG